VLYSGGGVFILDLHKASFVWASLTPGFIPADESYTNKLTIPGQKRSWW
jgi:hypothetical protein